MDSGGHSQGQQKPLILDLVLDSFYTKNLAHRCHDVGVTHRSVRANDSAGAENAESLPHHGSEQFGFHWIIFIRSIRPIVTLSGAKGDIGELAMSWFAPLTMTSHSVADRNAQTFRKNNPVERSHFRPRFKHVEDNGLQRAGNPRKVWILVCDENIFQWNTKFRQQSFEERRVCADAEEPLARLFQECDICLSEQPCRHMMAGPEMPESSRIAFHETGLIRMKLIGKEPLLQLPNVLDESLF